MSFNTYLLLILLMGSMLLPSCLETQPAEAPPVQMHTVEQVQPVVEPTLLYGLPIDSFTVVNKKIRWNQTLSTILSKYNVSGEAIFELAQKARGIFDVRKLKAGKYYTIIHERDKEKTARQFIFEPDPTEYFVFNLVDSIHVRKVKKEVQTVEREISAKINSSLYLAALDAGASPALVSRLVDIFAWQVDFFRIQKGDEFKVIYEEQTVGEEVVGLGRVKGGYFKHMDKTYYAILYEKGGKEYYFDENGNSMRRTFLRAPLNYRRISSRFSPRRYHPVLKRYKAHLGTDYAAPIGTPIRTVGDGVVLEAKYGKYNGNYVKIRHNANYTTQYLHMQKIAGGIRPGKKVKQGQTIGFVGKTGLANGPHLCFRFWKNGRQVNALSVDLPPSDPIAQSELTPFLHTKNVVLHKLDLMQIKSRETVLANVGSQP
ncbi:MAG: peptidoglycan DD-metalloendopeptidase family protein [Cyclobacteriaceae bacterium]|nr:peptidoglycan DD-metalloendopeptidase family protein [Cyclobacteriaceae bacterium HetDA_MAG_MS6]